MTRIPSWIPEPISTEFPIENLPFGIGKIRGNAHAVTRIGDTIIDLTLLEARGLFRDAIPGNEACFQGESLNAFMGMGSSVRRKVRHILTDTFRGDAREQRFDSEMLIHALIPADEVEMVLPARIGDYTDFYSSKEHATNVGIMFRGKENALMPNWLHLPVGYHGRASSVVASGTPVRRPYGQTKADDAADPVFGPCRLLDFELEMGFYIDRGNALGEPIGVEDASDHIFGLSLVNDWSARDIQKWEYVPLGPFLAKNFATTVSPWIITPEALEPFRCQGPDQDPQPLPYLKQPERATYDIHLEVLLQTPELTDPVVISKSNFRYLYWSMAQQVAHHTITGCNLQTGDLLASGTISGPTPDSYGSLLELTWRGTKPITLPDGQERRFLQDGDTLILRAWCNGDGYRIGFGECSGTVIP